jgi:hypothetical protein
LGVALPSAIAASTVRPSEKVISISGDGGFLFSAMELETAVRLKANIVHLVWIDGAYDMVAEQEALVFAPGFVDLTCMRWAPARPGFEDDGTLPFGMPERHNRYKEQCPTGRIVVGRPPSSSRAADVIYPFLEREDIQPCLDFAAAQSDHALIKMS